MSKQMRRHRLRIEELNDPGVLNKKIKILKLKSDDNRVGGQRNEEWVQFTTAWANLHTFSGSERFENNQSYAELTHRILIRYRKGIDRQMRIEYNGRFFEIDYIINVNEDNRFLALHVSERV